MPGRAENMGDGWETRRRREPGHDWAILRLAQLGSIEKLEIDTNFFKGNFPDLCWIEAVSAPGKFIDGLNYSDFKWEEMLSRVKLKADHRHYFTDEILKRGPWSHLKINIAPDGGISRLRAWGRLANV